MGARAVAGWAGILLGGAAAALAATDASRAEDVPGGYQQIIPRGRIASVDHPRFVPARNARLPSDAWVLGVVVEGEARAYSLNLLNRHEIVNDRAGNVSSQASGSSRPATPAFPPRSRPGRSRWGGGVSRCRCGRSKAERL